MKKLFVTLFSVLLLAGFAFATPAYGSEDEYVPFDPFSNYYHMTPPGGVTVTSDHWRVTLNNTTTTFSSLHSHREHRALGTLNAIIIVRAPWRARNVVSSVTHNHNAGTIMFSGIEIR